MAGSLGPRRILVRDASAVLIVLALLVLGASQIPPAPASGENNASNLGAAASGGVLIPRGTLNLFSATPAQSLASGEPARPTFDITHATLPPWCANPTCTIFVTPSPSPTPTPKATSIPTSTPPVTPTPAPTATPKPPPTATPVPTPTPVPQVRVPNFNNPCTNDVDYAALLTSSNLVPGGDTATGNAVVDTSPAAGTFVDEGSTVTVTAGSSPCP